MKKYNLGRDTYTAKELKSKFGYTPQQLRGRLDLWLSTSTHCNRVTTPPFYRVGKSLYKLRKLASSTTKE